MKLALPVFVLLVLTISIFAASYCSALEQYRQKVQHYKEIAASEEKLKSAGIGKEQIERVLSSLGESVSKAERLCEKEKSAASSASALETDTGDTDSSGTTADTLQGGSESSAGAAKTATANTDNANERAIEARKKAAEIRSTAANVRLNITGTGVISARTTPIRAGAGQAESASGASAAVPSTGELARFAYWWGKVTMVQTTSGGWAPASNMRDGANINPLTYCKQLDSRALGVREVGKQHISGWINRDGIADSAGRASYSEAGVVYECLPYKYWDVRTQLNPKVPLFAAPSDMGSTQTAVAQAAVEGAADSASVTSDEVVAPTGTSAAGDVSDYYKQKMQAILQKSDNVDAQIAHLKQLSSEINRLIGELLAKKSRISLQEEGMKELVQSVRITPTKVSTGDVAVEAKGKIIEAKVAAKKPIEVEAKEGKVVLRDNGVEAQASEVDVTSDAVTVGGSDVKILPSEIAKKVNAVSKKIRIATNAQKKAVYNVDAQTKAKILGILPVTMQHTVEINAQDGSTISDSKPWWGAIAVEDETQPPAAAEDAGAAEAS